MLYCLLVLSFPEWRPHFSFLDTPHANEMIALRWLHLVFGIIWIGLLYFFNLVLTPAMRKCDPKLRIKIYPELMPGAMGWFRSSALVTVIVGLRYFTIHLSSDARVAVIASGGLTHFVIDEAFDARVLEAIRRGDVSAFQDLPEELFQSGTSEIKNWITVEGAMAEAGLAMQLLDYVPCYRSEAGTGSAMGFAQWC